MSWINKLAQALRGGPKRTTISDNSTIISITSKIDPASRVKPKQEVVTSVTSTKPNVFAATGKTDAAIQSRARPNNAEIQARIDKRTRVIDQ